MLFYRNYHKDGLATQTTYHEYVPDHKIVGLDFETFSGTDIRTRGLDNYFADPDFKPLVAAVALPGEKLFFDFVMKPQEQLAFKNFVLEYLKAGYFFAAHNAAFEYNVLRKMGIPLAFTRFIDTAVLSAQAGGGRALASAAKHLLVNKKMEEGMDLIRLFAIPNELFDHQAPTKQGIERNPVFVEDWGTFKEYALMDAQLSKDLTMVDFAFNYEEQAYANLTHEMNMLGWKVDMDAVHRMDELYQKNMEQALTSFRLKHDPKGELNLNSLPQLKKWCAERRIKATSFNERSVETLMRVIDRRIRLLQDDPKTQGYLEVYDMLRTKQILGGSSLKKLKTLKDQVGPDDRLRNQYLHLGASQTFRTSGRGVQMQNLKRLSNQRDMEDLFDPKVTWDNDDLANNMRQLFTATNPDPEKGALMVGDFSSVESRGLAWLADARWKLLEYRKGMDMYKVLATKMYDKEYEFIDHAERTAGKVGELSCGYGAGPMAVQSFATGMGLEMNGDEARTIVSDWRAANPEVTKLWRELDTTLKKGVKHSTEMPIGPEGAGFSLVVEPIATPPSLVEQHPGVQSILVTMVFIGDSQNKHITLPLFSRVFHGVYYRGKSLHYYKPSERKTGNAWSGFFTDPKTKQRRYYDIYGGKLAGILTQSFCRELFFSAVEDVDDAFYNDKGVHIVGQFHDEIVLDVDLELSEEADMQDVADKFHAAMTVPRIKGIYVGGFPLATEIGWDWRYSK